MVNFGSFDGLSPVQCQANTGSHADYWTFTKKNLVEIESNHKIFFQGNAFGNVVCNMADILFRPQLLKGINYHIYLDTKYCRWNLIIVDDKRPRSIEATTAAALSIVS